MTCAAPMGWPEACAIVAGAICAAVAVWAFCKYVLNEVAKQ
jgi:hypothetical protein